MAYIIVMMGGHGEGFPKGFQSVMRAMLFILYFTKLLMAVVILVDDLRRLLFGALNLGFSDWKLSTQRSQWMTYTAVLLGAIPFLSLTYGMARNPYRYRLQKTRIPVKDLHPDLQGLRRFLLTTKDAHGLYVQFGFVPYPQPERLMTISRPDMYKNKK